MDLSAIPVIDTHEHLRPEEERVRLGGDLFATFFSHYASTDLLAAGLAWRDLDFVRDPGQPLEARWKLVGPWWPFVRHTGYGQALRIAARDLYGIEDLNTHTIRELAEAMRAASAPGLYRRIFDRAQLRCAIVQDIDAGALPAPLDPPDLLHPVLKAGPLVWVRSRAEIEFLQWSVGHPPVYSLADYLDLCQAIFRRAQGSVAVKLAHAYVSSLQIPHPTIHEAEQAFNRITRRRELFGLDESLSWEEARPLRAYLVHQVIQLAVRHNLPIQIHTGLLEHTFNDLRDAHPHHLIPLFLAYPEARFVLFHGGYPWLREFAVLGKSFPNVWLDLSWLWVISPQAGRDLLHELIELVPTNKVCAFGGDYLFVEGVYGHSVIMRRNVTRVLEEQVSAGWLMAPEALEYARRILHDNPRDLYRL